MIIGQSIYGVFMKPLVNFKSQKQTLFLMAILFAVILSGCQDHHYVPYDEMGPLEEPVKTDRKVKERPTPPSAPSKPVSPMGRQSAGDVSTFKGTVVAGVVNLGSGHEDAQNNDWTLFISVRPLEGGAPIAVYRALKPTFPFNFTLTEMDLMIGTPVKGTGVRVEARLDSDGDAMSRGAGDLYGKAGGNPTVGSKGVEITLGQQPE